MNNIFLLHRNSVNTVYLLSKVTSSFSVNLEKTEVRYNCYLTNCTKWELAPVLCLNCLKQVGFRLKPNISYSKYILRGESFKTKMKKIKKKWLISKCWVSILFTFLWSAFTLQSIIFHWNGFCVLHFIKVFCQAA
jgi:hypothetical protein